VSSGVAPTASLVHRKVQFDLQGTLAEPHIVSIKHPNILLMLIKEEEVEKVVMMEKSAVGELNAAFPA